MVTGVARERTVSYGAVVPPVEVRMFVRIRGLFPLEPLLDLRSPRSAFFVEATANGLIAHVKTTQVLNVARA